MIFVLDQNGYTSIPIRDDALIYIQETGNGAYDIIADDLNVISRQYLLGRYCNKEQAKYYLKALNMARDMGGTYMMREDDDDYWRY